MKNLLKIFVEKLKLALKEKTGWGRNGLLKLIDNIYIQVLSEALEGKNNEKNKS